MMKRLVGVSAAMIAIVLLAACETSKNSEDNILGSWTLSKLTIKGVTWSALNPSVISPGGQTVITPDMVKALDPNARVSVTLTFNKDKTAIGAVDAFVPGQPPVSQSASGTWSASSDKLTINYQDGPDFYTGTFIFEASKSKLTVEISNQMFRQILSEINPDLSALSPAQRDMVMALSGTLEFTK